MNELANEDLFFIYIGVLFFLWALSLLLFSGVSVRYIEREMAKEGIEPPRWDKGIGGRYVMYAMVLILNKPAKASLVHNDAILRLARKKDRSLAWFLISVSTVFFISAFAGYAVFAPAE